MVKYKEPKDFMIARRAYEAFYDEQPQVWFEDLGHALQMRWTRVARAVEVELKRLKVPMAKQPPHLVSDELAAAQEELSMIMEDLPTWGGSKMRLRRREVPPDTMARIRTLRERIKALKKKG